MQVADAVVALVEADLFVHRGEGVAGLEVLVEVDVPLQDVGHLVGDRRRGALLGRGGKIRRPREDSPQRDDRVRRARLRAVLGAPTTERRHWPQGRVFVDQVCEVRDRVPRHLGAGNGRCVLGGRGRQHREPFAVGVSSHVRGSRVAHQRPGARATGLAAVDRRRGRRVCDCGGDAGDGDRRVTRVRAVAGPAKAATTRSG